MCSLRSGIDLDQYVWPYMSEELMESLRTGMQPNPRDRRELVDKVAKYMIKILKDGTRSKCGAVAEIICEKYPNSFMDIIDSQIFGKGMETLRCQLYNAVNYRKQGKVSSKRKNGEVDSDDEEISNKIKEMNRKNGDEYGCIDYAPLLKPGEETLQEEKRLILNDKFQFLNRNEDEICELMKETYVLQRLHINAKDRNLQLICVQWPFLKEPQFLIEHANRLLGKNITATWYSCLEKNNKPLRQYLQFQNLKSEKNASRMKIINSYKQACEITRSKGPKVIGAISLLIHHFSEVENALYHVTDVSVIIFVII